MNNLKGSKLFNNEIYSFVFLLYLMEKYNENRIIYWQIAAAVTLFERSTSLFRIGSWMFRIHQMISSNQSLQIIIQAKKKMQRYNGLA